MSDPTVKSLKRHPPRHSTSAPAKRPPVMRASVPPKSLAKRSPAGKAPARKASKAVKAGPAKSRTAKKKVSGVPRRGKSASVKTKASTTVKHTQRTVGSSKSLKKSGLHSRVEKSVARRVPRSTSKTVVKSVAKPHKVGKPATGLTKPNKHLVRPIRASHPKSQPSPDEAAALRAFELARKEFSRGRFAEARNQFRTVVEKHNGVSEVAARARTYLAIAEARLRTENALPRDADSLYDRGVIELNRGEYVAAQEMFERALKREPDAAHVHYGLAATRARLGSIELALESLRHALGLQPSLRVRAQHDIDLMTLRNEPDFERLVFASRF